MLSSVISGLAIFASILAALSAKASSEDADREAATGVASDGYAGVRYNARKLAALLSLGRADALTLERLFLVQSWSESKGNVRAANESASESRAAKAMFQSRGNDEKLRKAVGPFTAKDWYFPGSAGWFGLMPVVLINVVKGRNAKGIGLGPRSNVDPWASTVMYAAYLSALIRRSEWARSSRDAYALKAGGAAGSLMDDPHKDRYKTAARHVDSAAKALGIPRSFGRQEIHARTIFGGRDWLAVYKEGIK
jgi:hypothetical protein